MRTLILSLAFSIGLTSAPAFAVQMEDLPAAIKAFVAEEAPEASPEKQDDIASCIMGAFADLTAAELESILAQDDFEDTLDALVETYPEREDTIENCEET